MKEVEGEREKLVAWCYSEVKQPGEVKPLPSAGWEDRKNIYIYICLSFVIFDFHLSSHLAFGSGFTFPGCCTSESH